MRNLVVALALVFMMPLGASAATVSVLPPSRAATVGDLLTVRVSVNTQGVAINQGEGTLTYPSGLLDVVSVSKSSSIFTLWVSEPNNAGAGLITWNGGLPTPGYSGGDGTMLTVVFRAKQAGSGTFALADAAIRANDGLGTDVLDSTSPASFTIGAAAAPPPATPAPAAPAAPTPSTPTSAGIAISSPTHPDENAWYANNSPLMTWTFPSGADAVQLLADRAPGATPTVLYKPAITEKRVSDLADGTWYFNIRARVGGAWGRIASYRINIDTTAPDVTAHTFTYDEGARSLALSVTAKDLASGIAGYELSIDTDTPKHIAADEFSNGSYRLAFDAAGQHTATLRVLDRAGNYTDVTGDFTVARSVLDTPLFAIGSIVVTLFWALLLMALLSLLSLIAAIAAWYLLYTRTGAPAARRRANRETVHKAFGLIRQDLGKHVRALRKARDGKELTKAEGDLGEEMNQNLTDLERYLNEHTDLLE